MTDQSADTLLLLGATGDLAKRMLLPSLFGLHVDGLLPPAMRIVASARAPFSITDYRTFVSEAIEPLVIARACGGDIVTAFLDRVSYVPIDASAPQHFAALPHLLGPARGPLAIFLSVAPSLFEASIAGLAQAGLADESARLGVEKPLGSDLATSRKINDAIATTFPEERTFRIDHYLGKETVQNLLALRFGNSLFEPQWNAGGIDHVQITIAETVGLEGRDAYYESSGALRDMVQNHMLQLLALVAMEPPGRFNATEVRDEKVKVLRALRPIDRASVAANTVTGQYGAGTTGGGQVPSYSEELQDSSSVETFVAIKAHVDNWRWKGVPFYLRTGKRLPCRRSEILVAFKPVRHSIFAGEGAVLQPNKLVIRLQPEENITLLTMAKQPGLDRDGIRLREVPLNLGMADAFADTRRRIAYERLLLDLIEGDPTLFVRRDEVEAQWEWIDAIRDGWAATDAVPRPYAAGTWGPTAAIALAERDGVTWHE